MTRLSPDETCNACGGVLVPPELAPDFRAPKGADYVCLKCGRPYRWTKENPPTLTVLVAAERQSDGGDDDVR